MRKEKRQHDLPKSILFFVSKTQMRSNRVTVKAFTHHEEMLGGPEESSELAGAACRVVGGKMAPSDGT